MMRLCLLVAAVQPRDLRVDVAADGALHMTAPSLADIKVKEPTMDETTSDSSTDAPQDAGERAPGQEAEQDSGNGLKPEEEQELEKYKFGIVRLECVVQHRDLSNPGAPPEGEEGFVGSGFVVANDDENGLKIITNGHVVNDAARLQVQIPSKGQTKYDATTILLNPDWDIAIVTVKGETRKKLLSDMGSDEIKVFEIAKSQVGAVSGLDVYAMGFPLGQDNAAFTKGTLAGSEVIGGYLVMQHTTPISPGSSGSPLLLKLDDGSFQVLGINFAAANAFGSQNNNYAIFGKRVTQMVSASTKLMSAAGGHEKLVENCESTPENCEFRIPRMDMNLVPPTKDVYDYYGCESGVLMTHIGQKSMMRWGATPPVDENAFVTEVTIEDAGEQKTVKLDRFGMGKEENIVQDPMHFRDILFMSDDLEKKVSFKTCSCGQENTHELSLGWTKEYNAAVPDIVQPSSSKMPFERFADVTVQPLNKQLAVMMVSKAQVMSLIPYVMEENDGKPQKPVLVATQAPMPETAGIEDENWRGIFAPGAVIESVNGKKVHTLDDYREAINPKSAEKSSCAAGGESELAANDTNKVANFLQTKECSATGDDAVVVMKTVDGAVFATKFMDALREEVKPADSKKENLHQLTEFTKDLAKANCIDVPESLMQRAAPSGFMEGAIKHPTPVKFKAIETRIIDRGGRITDTGRAVGWS
jgi:S1-C subfamily serine protease